MRKIFSNHHLWVLGCCSLILVSFSQSRSLSKDIQVTDAKSVQQAVENAQPGDVVILKSGEWRDVALSLYGAGNAEKPIQIRAEQPGKTVLTGKSRVRIAGEYLVLSGLMLHNIANDVVDPLEFRGSEKRRAKHCRVTQCAFVEDEDVPKGDQANRWIGIYGEDNQIDHCDISGKKNVGTTLVVWLSDIDLGKHKILSNHFDSRPPLGENGGETIRVGDSMTSMMTASCLIENNYFYHCDGEAEIISNKSCGNIFRKNWFVESQGALTLRHGNDSVVEGNVFLGNKRRLTGGVRVIGERQRVEGNYFVNLEGVGARSAISVVTGTPNSELYEYYRVIDAQIKGNVFLNCKESITLGVAMQDTSLPPLRTVFESNWIQPQKDRPAVRVLSEEDTVWRNNRIQGAVEGRPESDGMRGETGPAPAAPEMPDIASFGAAWRRGIAK